MLDLRELNKFIHHVEFRIVTMSSIIPSLDPGNLFRPLHLKDICFHMNIHLAHRRFVRFVSD